MRSSESKWSGESKWFVNLNEALIRFKGDLKECDAHS